MPQRLVNNTRHLNCDVLVLPILSGVDCSSLLSFWAGRRFCTILQIVGFDMGQTRVSFKVWPRRKILIEMVSLHRLNPVENGLDKGRHFR